MIRNIGFKKFDPRPTLPGDIRQRTLLDLHQAKLRARAPGEKCKAHIVFGTRPELIKLAPVIRQFEASELFTTKTVNTGQHVELLEKLLERLQIRVDYHCELMTKGQSLPSLYSRAIEKLNAVIVADPPDVIIVQGDTTSAAAGALVGFLNVIPVAHVEAGLRTFNLLSPFPEELNRILIANMAALHFAPTRNSVDNLVRAGIATSDIFLVGNTIIDALQEMIEHSPAIDAEDLRRFFAENEGRKKVLLTLHRRENQDARLDAILQTLSDLARQHVSEVAILYPVHYTPLVKEKAHAYFGQLPNVRLCEPIDYFDFVHVLKQVDFIVSDSGGIQEEALALRKPILILRENTERGEVVEAGVGHLIGNDTEQLRSRFTQLVAGIDAAEANKILQSKPYGVGRSAERILETVSDFLQGDLPSRAYDLSIVVPCYNEEKNVATIMDRLVEATRRDHLNAEIVLVDDHSVDETYAVGAEHAWRYPNVKMVTKSFPRGMGNAIRFGLNHVSTDIVVVTMADGSDDLSVLRTLYSKIKDEGSDLAIGSRYRDRRNAENIPPTYKFFSALFRFLSRTVLGIPLSDFTNAYRAFNWKKLQRIGLEGTGFEISPEITFKSWYLNRAVTEVDARHLKRTQGQSKFSFLKAGPGYGKMMTKALIARITKSWPYIDW
jgi:UDP-N-acetylglucosamine 2-epimerase (non-hydrolysing)